MGLERNKSGGTREAIEPDLFADAGGGAPDPVDVVPERWGVSRESGPAKKPPANPPANPPAKRPPLARKSGGGGFWRWCLRFFYLSVLLILLHVGVVWGVYLHFMSEGLPPLNSLADYRPNLLTRVYARDYQLLGEFYIQRRQFIPRSEMPQRLIDALLAIEDSRFYQHFGVDPKGMMRAFFTNLKSGGRKQGASTITQQVARTFLLTSVKSWTRKVKEIILALRIERRFSKDEILELYFNQIYMGAGAYGMGAAAHVYFARDVSELTLGQMALLAGLPKAPSDYNPWRDSEKALARRKLVLNRMAELGAVTAEEAAAAAEEPLNLAKPKESLEQVAPYYLEHVRRTIVEEWGTDQLYNGGLEVYTALDPRLQKAAQAAVQKGLVEYDRRHGYRGPLERSVNPGPAGRAEWLKKYEKKSPTVGGFYHALVLDIGKQGVAHLLLANGKEAQLPIEGVKWARPYISHKAMGSAPKKVADLLKPGDVILVEPPEGKRNHFALAQEPVAEAALVSMDPHTGQVVAMVGGYDFGRSEFNRAIQGIRQPGSAFKPFIFTSAMDKGFSPVDKVDDSPLPLTYRDPSTGVVKTWQPENYEHKYYGPTTLRVALAHSRNLVTVRLAKTLGVSYFAPYMRNFGLVIPPERHDLSLSLGSMGFSPLKMTAAYTVFANGGKLVEPVYIARVQDRYGRTVFRHSGGDCLLCHQEPEKIVPQPGEAQSAPLYGKPVLNPASVYQVVSLMKGVVKYGTARKALSLNRPVAGKTGTTNDMRDAWFMGIAPSLVAGVWVGMDDYSILGETGGTAALPIWIDYMQEALKGQPATDFPVPPGIALEEIDAETGEIAGADTPKNMRVYEAFKPGQGPLVADAGTAPTVGGSDEEAGGILVEGGAGGEPAANRWGSGGGSAPAGGGASTGEMDGGLY